MYISHFDKLDNTDELSFGLRLFIDMLNVFYLTLTSWATWTSCLLASDCIRICLMYVTWLWWDGQHGRFVFWPLIVYWYIWCKFLLTSCMTQMSCLWPLIMYRYVWCILLAFDKLDNTDELSFGFRLFIDMLNVFYLTLTSWATWTSCLLASDCIRICLMYVTWLWWDGQHGRFVFWPLIVYWYIWCKFLLTSCMTQMSCLWPLIMYRYV